MDENTYKELMSDIETRRRIKEATAILADFLQPGHDRSWRFDGMQKTVVRLRAELELARTVVSYMSRNEEVTRESFMVHKELPVEERKTIMLRAVQLVGYVNGNISPAEQDCLRNAGWKG